MKRTAAKLTKVDYEHFGTKFDRLIRQQGNLWVLFELADTTEAQRWLCEA